MYRYCILVVYKVILVNCIFLLRWCGVCCVWNSHSGGQHKQCCQRGRKLAMVKIRNTNFNIIAKKLNQEQHFQHNSDQSTCCKSCFPYEINPKVKREKLIPFFMLSNNWASCNEIPLELNYSFDVWVDPLWDNQNTRQRQIFNVKKQSYRPLNYKWSLGDFSPKMAVKGQNSCNVLI